MFLEIVNLHFLADEYEAAKLLWAGGAERPVWRSNEPKQTGARSARARTRGQNPLVLNIHSATPIFLPKGYYFLIVPTLSDVSLQYHM